MQLNRLQKVSFILLLLLPALMVTSCKKSSNPPKQSFSANAIVLDKGNVAADGCGWQIMISDSLYSPLNLGVQFQVNNLKVHVAYHKLTTTGFIAARSQMIRAQV